MRLLINILVILLLLPFLHSCGTGEEEDSGSLSTMVFHLKQPDSYPLGILDNVFTHHNAAGGAGHDYADGAMLQSDGKIVISGRSDGPSNFDMVTWRIDNNGVLDIINNYDVDDGNSNHENGYDALILQDGKMIIVGYIKTNGNYDAAVWKLNIDGSLDTSYATDGIFRLDNIAGGNGSDVAYSVGLHEKSGKVYVAGDSDAANGLTSLFVLKLSKTGVLDKKFGTNGVFVFEGKSKYNVPMHTLVRDVEVESNGGILICGNVENDDWSQSEFRVWKLTKKGAFDNSFNSDGIFTSNVNVLAACSSIKLRRDDGIAASAEVYDPATDNYNYAIAKLTPSGNLDRTYGQTFFWFIKLGYRYINRSQADYIASMALQYDDSVIAVGDTDFDNLLVARLDSNGNVDTSFGTNGYITHDNAAGGNGWDFGAHVQVLNDGRFVVSGGSLGTNGDYDLAVWWFR